MSAFVAAVAVAAVATVANVVQSQKQAKAQKAAGEQAAAASRAQAAQADRDFNRQNMKRPDVGAMLAGNTLAAQAGNAGTMLTGPGGIDPNMLQLQRNTLLGE